MFLVEELAGEPLGTVIAILSLSKKPGHFSSSVLSAHLPWPGMTAAPTDQYHNKVTLRHYLPLLTDRDNGHYQLS